MKYSHSSKHRKSCPHDPEHRAQLGFRLRASRCNLGWSIGDAAKYFQVTQRTWHNWESGAHRIPFAVYKLARVLANLELPGDAWAGWSIQGGKLITPEGRQISPQDGSWWSLLVRQAACFRSAYDESTRLRLQLARVHAVQPDACSPTPSTLLHAPDPTIWVSPSMPSFASPWTPTCGIRVTLNRYQPGPQWPSKSHLKQVNGNQPNRLNQLNQLNGANPGHSSPPDLPEPKGRPPSWQARQGVPHDSP